MQLSLLEFKHCGISVASIVAGVWVNRSRILKFEKNSEPD